MVRPIRQAHGPEVLEGQAHHPEQGRRTDGDSPVESRSITPQGGEAVAPAFGRPRGFKPRGRYNLMHKFDKDTYSQKQEKFRKYP